MTCKSAVVTGASVTVIVTCFCATAPIASTTSATMVYVPGFGIRKIFDESEVLAEITYIEPPTYRVSCDCSVHR